MPTATPRRIVVLFGLATIVAITSRTFWSPRRSIAALGDLELLGSSSFTPFRHQTNAYNCNVRDLNEIPPKHFKSQSDEDKTLLEWFNGLCNGTYVEMGAVDGLRYSNSYVFHKELAWKGVLVEMTPKDYAKLKVNRPEDLTVHAAVCDKRQTVHYVTGPNVGRVGSVIDGIWEFMAPSFREKWWRGITLDSNQVTEIECIPMRDILDQSPHRYFDFYSLDVEGAEFQVLQSIDFEKVGFGVILVEAVEFSARKNLAVRMFLESKGYPFLMESGRSYWFVNKDFAEIYQHRLHAS